MISIFPRRRFPLQSVLCVIASLFILGSFPGCTTKSSGSGGSSARGKTHGGPAGQIMTVRTTAYHHSEPGGRVNGVGRRLVQRHSAAADWSWLPAGTRFRILDTGEDYIIEDYGSALVGKKTIDIYKSSRREMNRWGVRHVRIQILEWGSWAVSLKVLEPRARHPHVRRMVTELRKVVHK